MHVQFPAVVLEIPDEINHKAIQRAARVSEILDKSNNMTSEIPPKVEGNLTLTYIYALGILFASISLCWGCMKLVRSQKATSDARVGELPSKLGENDRGRELEQLIKNTNKTLEEYFRALIVWFFPLSFIFCVWKLYDIPCYIQQLAIFLYCAPILFTYSLVLLYNYKVAISQDRRGLTDSSLRSEIEMAIVQSRKSEELVWQHRKRFANHDFRIQKLEEKVKMEDEDYFGEYL